MYNFDNELMNMYEQIKHKIYVEYCNGNITINDREILLERAKNDIFKNVFNTIMEADENENSKFSIEQKKLKCITKLRMVEKLISEKCDIVRESIKNIDEEKQDSIYFIFLNRSSEVSSVIKILDYLYSFIRDPSINSENYNNKKDDLIDDLNSSCKNVKIESYNINTYKNKFHIEFNESEIHQYENKYNIVFSSHHLNDIFEKNSDNITIIRNAYDDFFHWFEILLGYKNNYINQITRSIKIAEIYQNQLYDDYSNNKGSYNDLRSGTQVLKKLFQSTYKEYYNILDSKFQY